MKVIFTSFLCLCSFWLLAQPHPSCTELRYNNLVFDEISVTSNLKFGEGNTYAGNFQELYLDLYEPMGDTAAMRPVIVLAFGGSYIGGQREDLADLCERFAKMGYVAVTIDYRLYDGPFVPLPTGTQMTDVVVKSIGDMKAAIRFLREDAATNNLYQIDPDQIFVGGISAGAITAAHTAVIDSTDSISPELLMILEDNGGFEGNASANYEYSSAVHGFINFSGALIQATLIDANDPPFYSVHDEFDPVVPYDADFATIFTVPIIEMEGSQLMHARADSLGITNELHTIEGSNVHVSYLANPAQFDDLVGEAADFMRAIICKDFVSEIADPLALSSLAQIRTFPNPANEVLYIDHPEQLNLLVRLVDLTGRELATWTPSSQIALHQFPAGFYTLILEDQDSRNRVTKSIIIQK